MVSFRNLTVSDQSQNSMLRRFFCRSKSKKHENTEKECILECKKPATAFNLMKLDANDNIVWNHDGILQFLQRPRLNFQEILFSEIKIPVDTSRAFFGRQEQVLKELKTARHDVSNASEWREQGIYVSPGNVRSGKLTTYFIYLDDSYFHPDQMPQATHLLLAMMSRFCPGIEFLLSRSDKTIIQDIVELYSTNYLRRTLASSDDEILKLSWLYFLRSVVEEYQIPRSWYFEGYPNPKDMLHFIDLVLDEDVPKQGQNYRESARFRTSTHQVVRYLLTSLEMPLKRLGLVQNCISSLEKPCFVVCAIGRSSLKTILDHMTDNTFSISDRTPMVKLNVQDDFLIVVIDWSGHEPKDELKALALAANVANYTICSTEPSTLYPLFQKVVETDLLIPERSNNGPLSVFSQDKTILKTDDAFVATYFKKRIDTITCCKKDPDQLKAAGKRILLECRASCALSYTTGKACMERIKAAI